MLPVSPAFLATVRGSHDVRSRVKVIIPGSTGADPYGVRTLDVIEGAVTLDAQADVRGQLELLVEEPWPESNTVEDLVPYGTELVVQRGVIHGSSIEMVSLGIFRIDTVEQADAPDGPIRITAYDRMQGIVESTLEQPIGYSSSDTYGDIVNSLVTEVYPDAVIEWDDGSDALTIDRMLIAETDRFGFLNELVKSLGKVWYYDYRGVLVIRTPPSSTDPVVVVNGGANGVLVSATRVLSREGVYNAVVASGEALDNLPPARAVARDEDPASVTYYFGDFGKIALLFTSPFILTDAQAEDAAASLLEQVKGLPYSVDFQMIPNPALEPLDPVEVVYPVDLEATTHVRRERHTLDQLVIGLGASTGMQASTRQTFNEGA